VLDEVEQEVLLRLAEHYPARLLDSRNRVKAAGGLERHKPRYEVPCEHLNRLPDLNAVADVVHKLGHDVIEALVTAMGGVVVEWHRHEQLVLLFQILSDFLEVPHVLLPHIEAVGE